MSKRTIAIFTGNRAEYGLQYPILKAIAEHPDLEYCLIAGGAHLQSDFGGTLAEIEADGFKVHRQVEIELQEDTLYATAQAIGSGILSLSRILDEVRPDFLVVYADRYESFAAMITGTQMNIPTAHVEGGDITEGGALDDSVRHAMTKLAHLHFTTNEEASDRVRALGEEAWRVHNVGLPSLDLISAGLFASEEEVCAHLDLDLSRPVILFCQHSVTTEFEEVVGQIRPSLDTLEKLAGRGFQIIITYPNNDAGGKAIIAELRRFETDPVPNIRVTKSLGRHRFHGMLNLIGKNRGAFVGNSSAGIKETPAFGCPAVNIGSRQQGRLRAKNLIDIPYGADELEAAILKCAGDDAFREVCRTSPNPYGEGRAGAGIAETLATVAIDKRLLQKKMLV